MRCSSCGHENSADARFCERCGSPIASQEAPAESRAEMPGATEVCPTCGAERRPGLRFCEQCATPFPESPPAVAVAPAAPAKAPESAVSSSPTPPKAVRPMQPAPSVAQSVAGGGRVCSACGYLNPVTARHCADCGEALVARKGSAPARPSVSSRLAGILVRLVVSVVLAAVTAVATRYLVSYVIGLGLIP
jgi:predicted amidophosphoribosyltransferase